MKNRKEKLFIGCCRIDLYIESSHCLKDKRRVIKSIKDKIKNRYNVAVCEYGDLTLWQRAQLAVVTCANDKSFIDSQLKIMVGYLKKFYSVSLLNYNLQIF